VILLDGVHQGSRVRALRLIQEAFQQFENPTNILVKRPLLLVCNKIRKNNDQLYL
jgi:hypothetical protein